MDAVEQGAVLAAFSRTLQREAQVLTRHPDPLWQQICARPRMESMPLMEEHLR